MREPASVASCRSVSPRQAPTDIGRLLVTCADRPGIIAAVSGFLREHGANIAQSDQYSTDLERGRFFLRMAFHLDGLGDRLDGMARDFAATVAEPLGAEWRLRTADARTRVAIMVSAEDHCLMDLLWRWQRGELEDLEVVLVLSNHETNGASAASFGVPFAHVPVVPEDKPTAEARQLELLAEASVDLVVLARYMQILSPAFLHRVAVPVINIHHSFLPAFAGSEPYTRAKERGVKLIGATAHYVTEELDAGPIIEQDVVRVTHRDDVEALRRLGSDIERTVLARAVRAHGADRVLLDGATAVVF
jgi:formyltetrahydrofolate deformylase